jgi:hypothetical protein
MRPNKVSSLCPAKITSRFTEKPKLYLEVFDMEMILGVIIGLLIGCAWGMLFIKLLCSKNPDYMKSFEESCGYIYEESEEDET